MLGPVEPRVTVFGIGSRERDRMHTLVMIARIRPEIFEGFYPITFTTSNLRLR